MKFAVDFKPLEWKGAGQALRAKGACGFTYCISKVGKGWRVEHWLTSDPIGEPHASLLEAQAAAQQHHSEALAAWVLDIQPIND